MKLFTLLLLFLIGFSAGAQHIEKVELIVGFEMKFQSLTMNEQRILNIYLPAGYNENDSINYPVIYLLDGSIDEDFIHIMGIVQFQSYPWINTIPESIVVGISNVDRKRDFTFPTTIQKDKDDFPTTGGSSKFITFLEQEVKPLIKTNFRINENATLIGQSLGGLLATEILLTKPELFTHYLIVSPSLWWDKESLLLKKSELPKGTTVHVAVGKEGRVMVNDAKHLVKKLRKENKLGSDRISFEYFKKNSHADILHMAAYSGLKMLYSHNKK